jgi:hypothetical protein
MTRVVQRRDQRIGQGMRKARQMRVEPGRIDDEEVGLPLDLDDGLTEQVELKPLVLLDRIRARQRQVEMRRVRQLEIVRLGPVAAVPNVLGEGLLAAVHVDRGDAKALVHQIDRQMEAVVDLPEPPFSLPTTMTCVPAAVHHTLLPRRFPSATQPTGFGEFAPKH